MPGDVGDVGLKEFRNTGNVVHKGWRHIFTRNYTATLICVCVNFTNLSKFVIGERGDKGFKGPMGEQGYRGNIGFVGQKGERGPMGYKGEEGFLGDRGKVGRPGEAGKTEQLRNIIHSTHRIQRTSTNNCIKCIK